MSSKAKIIIRPLLDHSQKTTSCINSMATCIKRLVASGVFPPSTVIHGNHRVSNGVFCNHQVAARHKRAFFCCYKKYFFFWANLRLMGVNCRLAFHLQFSSIKTQSWPIFFIFFLFRQKSRPFCNAQQLNGYGKRQLKLDGEEKRHLQLDS